MVTKLTPIVLGILESIHADAQHAYLIRLDILDLQTRTLMRRYNAPLRQTEQDPLRQTEQERRDLLNQIEIIQMKSNRLSDIGPVVLDLVDVYKDSQIALSEFAQSTFEPGDLVLLRLAVDRFSSLARSANERF